MPATVRLENRIPEMTANTLRYMDAVIRKEAFDMERDMKVSMKGPKHGVIYHTRTPSGKEHIHQASAPGEAPAIDTGELVNSIESITPHFLQAMVLILAEYAAYLEYGTVHMDRRPFVMPAVEKCILRLARVRIPAAAFTGKSAMFKVTAGL